MVKAISLNPIPSFCIFISIFLDHEKHDEAKKEKRKKN